jgi:cytochrome c2
MLKSIVSGIIVCLGVAATAAAQDAKVAKGESVYAEQKCSLCHSIADKGNKKGPLDGVAAKYSAAELGQWLTDAKGMTAKTKATRKPDMKTYTLPKEDVTRSSPTCRRSRNSPGESDRPARRFGASPPDLTRPTRPTQAHQAYLELGVVARTVGYLIPSCSRYDLYFVGS